MWVEVRCPRCGKHFVFDKYDNEYYPSKEYVEHAWNEKP